MIAVHIHKGRVSVREVPKPERPKKFALIRMLRAGICNTDLELKRGYYNFSGIPGHEFVGVVVEADRQDLVGKRVVGEINLACGKCDFCINHIRKHCSERTVLGIVKHPGAFAEFLTLPEQNLHVVPDSLSDDEAVFVEPVAAARVILDQVSFLQGEPVAVLGDGKLGLLISQALSASEVKPYLFGRHPDKMRIAERAGARVSTFLPNPGEFDYVVDATGTAEGLTQALQIVRPRGVVIMKSTVHGTPSIDTARIVVNENVLMGSRCGSFEPALKLLASGKINVTDMIVEHVPLADAPRAFERAERKGTLKILLDGVQG